MRPQESYIGQPIRSLQEMLRVIARSDGQYILLIPDGIYGPETKRAVMVFQQKNALPVTGITDLNTWEKVVEEYELHEAEMQDAIPIEINLAQGEHLQNGNASPNVVLMQSMLQHLAEYYHCFTCPPLSRIMDNPTQDALSAFQTLCGLPATGELDKTTWKHLALQYPFAVDRYQQEIT